MKPTEDSSEKADGFRHTSAQRRNIIKIIRLPTEKHVKAQSALKDLQREITLNNRFGMLGKNESKSKFKITASSSVQGLSNQTHLVYVGCLSKQTTANDIRKHSQDIVVRNEEVADVINLNCKNGQQPSFCISVHGDEEKAINIFSKDNWPGGVQIRPFYLHVNKGFPGIIANVIPRILNEVRDRPFDIRGGGGWDFSSRQVIFSLFLHNKLFFSKVNCNKFFIF